MSLSEYCRALGLEPGGASRVDVEARFNAVRRRAIEALCEPALYYESRRRLDEAYVARRALAAVPLADPRDAADVLRLRIRASIEDGLIRHSRREAILEHAARLGIGEFQAQLMIAQVLFDDDRPLAPASQVTSRAPRAAGPALSAWAQLAAVGVLAASLLILMLRWVQD